MNPDAASLDRLHDIIFPPPVAWWPPAPGWLWLLGILLVAVLVILLRAFFRWQRNLYRLEALAELRRHEALLKDPAQRPGALAAMGTLLKRAALSAWPRRQIASLTGASWSTFLDRTGDTTAFSNGAGALIEAANYQPATLSGVDEARCAEAAGHVRRWLIHHQVDET